MAVGWAMPALAQDADGGTGATQADALKQLEGFQKVLQKEIQDAGSDARLKKCLEDQKKKVDGAVNSLASPLPKWGVIYTLGFEAYQKSRACANTKTGESAEQLTVEEAADLAKNVPGASTSGITPVTPLIPPAASPTI